MNKVFAAALTAVLTISSSLAGAVVLNPNGLGQVLIYPYYTVNAGLSTLLTIVNTTPRGKALRVRFHEGYNGRNVGAFNLYLSPFDTWVGQLYDSSADGTGAPILATSDKSCTVPIFDDRYSPPGFKSETLVNFGYITINADGGPSAESRTREGYFEVIEMGEVTNDTHNTLSAIEHDAAGVTANCEQLNIAWSPGGYWTLDPHVDLSPPTGGLYGEESLINVGEGLLYSVNALAIDGFSRFVQHTFPGGSAVPDLDTASRSASGSVTAFVPLSDGFVQADYDNPVDAISALFMADNLYNEFVVDSQIGAKSDWIVTFPTKRFYTDPALLGSSGQARSPFEEKFGSGGSCAEVTPKLVNREALITIDCAAGLACPARHTLCYAANSVPIGTANSVLGSQLQLAPTIDARALDFRAGQMQVDFSHHAGGTPIASHVLTSTNGITLRGLPAVGFLAVDYVNANVTPGVLATYSGAYPHHPHVACQASSNSAASCP